MAMAKRFTENVMVRLSKAGKKGLDQKAKSLGIGPAVAARLIIEHSVDIISTGELIRQLIVRSEHHKDKKGPSK